MITTNSTSDNYPPRWGDYRIAADLIPFCPGFSRAANVNRFGARYRLAKSCEVKLTGYGASTTAGYNALVKVALSWSAFESLLPAIGLNKHAVAEVSVRHDLSEFLVRMRAAGKIEPFFKFVASELDTKGQIKAVNAFLSGDQCCGLNLAKAVRHIFFHGTLTPNAGGAEAADVAVACMALSDGLVSVMDAEFLAGVNSLRDAAKEFGR